MKKQLSKTIQIDRADLFFTDLDSVIKYLTELNNKYDNATLSYEFYSDNLEISLDYSEYETDIEYETRLKIEQENTKKADLKRLENLEKEIDLIKQKYGL